ncbi:MAG: LCP family protein [Nitriliruptoraceae bacterium]
MIAVVLVVLAGAGAALVLSGIVDLAFLERARELVSADAEPEVAAEVGEQQPTLVLVTTGSDADADTGARAITVLAHDQETGQGTLLLVPVATVVDVPGHGTFPLSEVHDLGGASLVRVSLANLLGIPFDGVLTLSKEAWATILDRIGSTEVTIDRRLREPPTAGTAVRFEPGTHVLDGVGLASYLTARAEGETELEALPRLQQVLTALLDRVAAERTLSVELPSLLVERGQVEGGEAEVDVVAALLDRLATARAEDRITTVTLPVSPLGDGRDDRYRVDAERAEQLVVDRFAGARPEDAIGAGTGVQILNGNGMPRVGQRIAERLSGGGYRIIVTGDADRSTYETTRVVVNEATEEQLAVARDIVERLGAGEVERAATPSSVVDITIVVGGDFPPDQDP